MSEETQHPLYPDRENRSVTVRGTTNPGWFTGPAAIWTAGAAPKIIGPFDDVKQALQYQSDHAQGSQIFPYYTPEQAK